MKVMDAQASLLHGADCVSYKHYPIVLGKCLQCLQKSDSEIDLTISLQETQINSLKDLDEMTLSVAVSTMFKFL